jgi:hypothetical protein
MRTNWTHLASLALGLASQFSNLNVVQGVSYGTCTTGSSFYCTSKCDGAFVEDCFSCDGYITSDASHEICINRHLFQPHNTDPNDYDDHYHYLWNDLVGAVVFFFGAGIGEYMHVWAQFIRR